MRSWVIDLLKFLGAQCIVIHHLMAHGPMADVLEREYPNAVDAIFTYSRLAVQMFLVIAGFLAAKSLMRARGTHLGDLLLKRYLRLAPFYVLSLFICVLVVGALGGVVDQDWVRDSVSGTQILAHALMLQGVLHVPSISAGVWYVAIDFQLFALVAVVASICGNAGAGRIKITAQLLWVLAAMCVSSLWIFNQFEWFDDWAIYFMGAYGLGLLAAFASQFNNTRTLFFTVWLLGLASLALSWRLRIVVALFSAALLFFYADHSGQALGRVFKRVLAQLGNAAYATFLSHFALVVVFSAIWNAAHLQGLMWALSMVVLCWLTATAWGLVLNRLVEPTLNRWIIDIQFWWTRLGSDQSFACVAAQLTAWFGGFGALALAMAS